MTEMTPDDEESYRPQDEARKAVEALSGPDLLRLQMIAKQFAWGVLSADDLVQEVLLRVLQERRKWSKSISFMEYCKRTMRSIVSDENRAWAPTHIKAVGQIPDDGSNVPHSGPDVLADGIEAEQLIREIQELFADDEEAGLILFCRGAGDSPRDIREALGMGKSQYATVLRRIRRRMNAHFSSEGAVS